MHVYVCALGDHERCDCCRARLWDVGSYSSYWNPTLPSSPAAGGVQVRTLSQRHHNVCFYVKKVRFSKHEDVWVTTCECVIYMYVLACDSLFVNTFVCMCAYVSERQRDKAWHSGDQGIRLCVRVRVRTWQFDTHIPLPSQKRFSSVTLGH